MARSPRLSAQTIAVVLALAETPATWRHGYELCQRPGLKAGSMYPILIRLADRDLRAGAAEIERGQCPVAHERRLNETKIAWSG